MSFILHVFLYYSLSFPFGFSALLCFQSLIFCNFVLLFAFLTIFYFVCNIYDAMIEGQFDRNICP